MKANTSYNTISFTLTKQVGNVEKFEKSIQTEMEKGQRHMYLQFNNN